jgi:hypothetical protein
MENNYLSLTPVYHARTTRNLVPGHRHEFAWVQIPELLELIGAVMCDLNSKFVVAAVIFLFLNKHLGEKSGGAGSLCRRQFFSIYSSWETILLVYTISITTIHQTCEEADGVMTN